MTDRVRVGLWVLVPSTIVVALCNLYYELTTEVGANILLGFINLLAYLGMLVGAVQLLIAAVVSRRGRRR